MTNWIWTSNLQHVFDLQNERIVRCYLNKSCSFSNVLGYATNCEHLMVSNYRLDYFHIFNIQVGYLFLAIMSLMHLVDTWGLQLLVSMLCSTFRRFKHFSTFHLNYRSLVNTSNMDEICNSIHPKNGWDMGQFLSMTRWKGWPWHQVLHTTIS